MTTFLDNLKTLNPRLNIADHKSRNNITPSLYSSYNNSSNNSNNNNNNSNSNSNNNTSFNSGHNEPLRMPSGSISTLYSSTPTLTPPVKKRANNNNNNNYKTHILEHGRAILPGNIDPNSL